MFVDEQRGKAFVTLLDQRIKKEYNSDNVGTEPKV